MKISLRLCLLTTIILMSFPIGNLFAQECMNADDCPMQKICRLGICARPNACLSNYDCEELPGNDLSVCREGICSPGVCVPDKEIDCNEGEICDETIPYSENDFAFMLHKTKNPIDVFECIPDESGGGARQRRKKWKPGDMLKPPAATPFNQDPPRLQ